MEYKQSDIDRLYQLARNYNNYMPGVNQDINLGAYNKNNSNDLSNLALQIVQARQGGFIPSRTNPIYVNNRYGYDNGKYPLNYSQYGFGIYGY